LPLYLQYKGLNGTEIGWVLAVEPLASIFSQPFWGYMCDKYKTIKNMLLILIFGLLICSILFFHMDGLLAILILCGVLFFFRTPIGSLSASLALRRAVDLHVSFGTIRTWGSVGFATSALVVGELLSIIGIQYMVWPYIGLGTVVLIVIFRLQDVKVDSEPIKLQDVKQL